MEDKIDYAKCMTRKYEECNRYNYCFKYKTKNINKKRFSTNYDKKHNK